MEVLPKDVINEDVHRSQRVNLLMYVYITVDKIFIH